MKKINHIPIEFESSLLFFKSQMYHYFSFLQDYNFTLTKEESGQTKTFKDYFIDFTFTNGDTVIKIHFCTDIINGRKTAFPKLKDEELPGVDSQITCSIWDKNAFMSMHSFIETKFPEISKASFTIILGCPDLDMEIKRVTKNYSDFIKTNLTEVLEKNTIYDCYTDRFYDKIFKEIHYL
ncbi:MAG: hypothetical protein WCK09_05310 [Bacteroidota bacterium]